MKNLLSTLLKVAVSGGILFLIFRKIDTGLFLETVRSANPVTVAGAAVIVFLTQAVSSYRWQTILKKDMYVPYRKLLSIYLVGMFFNNFLPTLVGGDVIKGYYLYKSSGRGNVSLASIFMDRYSGFTALMFITTVSVIAGYGLIQGTGLEVMFALLISAFLGMSAVIWVGPLHSWAMALLQKVHFYGLNRKIDATYQTLMSYKSRPGILITIFVCSLWVQGTAILGHFIIGWGIGMDLSVGYFFLFVPLATVVSMVPVSLAGLGLREGAFVYLFTMVGGTQEQALSVSLMYFAMMVLVSLIGGFEYVRMGGRKELAVGDGDVEEMRGAAEGAAEKNR